MKRFYKILPSLAISMLAIHLIAFYGIIFYVKSKVGHLPSYDNPSSGDFNFGIFEDVIIDWAMVLFIVFALFFAVISIYRKRFWVFVFAIVVTGLTIYFQVYINPFIEWYLD